MLKPKLRRAHSEEKLPLITAEDPNIANPNYFKSTTKTKRAAKKFPGGEGWKGRVAAYCTADSYDIDALFAYFGRKANLDPILYRDVIHIQYEGEMCDIFIFPYGAIIIWGLNIAAEKEILLEIKKFTKKPLTEIQYDDFDFSFGDSTKMVNDEIILEDRDPMIKLSLSHGLSQSIKLSVFEENIETLIEDTKNLPEQLSITGKINLSRKEISKMIGRLFIQRNLINLHSDILDIPDFFWENDEYEKYYQIASTYLDKSQRVEVLNKRLVVVAELLDMLRSELHSKNDAMLEWVIIILIVVEVLLELLDVLLYRFDIGL